VILFFDTETTGFYSNRLPFDHDDQPRLVQIALPLTEDDGEPVASASLIVNPGVPIPERAAQVHGITNERAEAMGVSEKTALALFTFMADRSDLIVAHNIAFDINVMACAYARSGHEAPEWATFCTMDAACPIINLPPTDRMKAAGINRPKSPRLEECVRHFFDEDLEGAHDAIVDLNACARVFFHLKSLDQMQQEATSP